MERKLVNIIRLAEIARIVCVVRDTKKRGRKTMAELIKLNDGSIIPLMDTKEIPEIVKEHLSEELSNKIYDLMNKKTEGELLLQDELEGYEMSLEEQHDLLLQIDEKLKEIRDKIWSGKITKQRIARDLQEISETITLYL